MCRITVKPFFILPAPCGPCCLAFVLGIASPLQFFSPRGAFLLWVGQAVLSATPTCSVSVNRFVQSLQAEFRVVSFCWVLINMLLELFLGMCVTVLPPVANPCASLCREFWPLLSDQFCLAAITYVVHFSISAPVVMRVAVIGTVCISHCVFRWPRQAHPWA